MFKALIVDDERIVRSGIRNSINWNEYGIEMIAEAENGVEALDQVMADRPDLILLDICMPRMDGLEFAGIVKKKFPSIHIVIITGFNDFEYARNALRAGVDDYILKPVNKEIVSSIVSGQIEQLKRSAAVRLLLTARRIYGPHFPIFFPTRWMIPKPSDASAIPYPCLRLTEFVLYTFPFIPPTTIFWAMTTSWRAFPSQTLPTKYSNPPGTAGRLQPPTAESLPSYPIKKIWAGFFWKFRIISIPFFGSV